MSPVCTPLGEVARSAGEGTRSAGEGTRSAGDKHCAYLNPLTLNPFFLTEEEDDEKNII